MLSLDLDAFATAAGWAALPEDIASRNFQRTAKDIAFPGAILPAVSSDGTVLWYGVAATATHWRQLQPLLLAYAGPTVTHFTGRASSPDVAVPAERVLHAAGIQAMARLVPGENCLKLATLALDRLCNAVALRPAATRTVPESTAGLLARLDMGLASGDRKAAEDLLGRLRAELRLDTLNLHFVEVRILSTFRSWRELVDAEWFSELCLARKPSMVAAAMLEALWHARLLELAGDEAQLVQKYRDVVQPLARPLLAQVTDGAGEFVQRFRLLDEIPVQTPPTAEVAAQELLDRAADAPSNLHLAQALSAIEALPEQTRDTLLQSGAGQQAVAEIGSLDVPLPTNWSAWLAALPDPRFMMSAIVAREGITQWPAQDISDAELAVPLAESLLRVGLSGDLGSSRLIGSLPSLVRWVKGDPGYPRPALASIYEALLQLFDLLDRRGAPERDAAADLLEALLSLGTSKRGYRRLLVDFEKLIDEGAGTSSVYWLMDVAAALLAHPAPDQDARLILLNRILVSLQDCFGLLSPGQRASYNRLANVASWPVLPAPVATATPAGFELLKGQSIAIYTLTESAGRRAEEALKELLPSIRIDLAHDHVASPRLTRLAREADIFVMSAASAKHAATDCIVANRGTRPLLYAAGRGFSSIIRAVEEYALEFLGKTAATLGELRPDESWRSAGPRSSQLNAREAAQPVISGRIEEAATGEKEEFTLNPGEPVVLLLGPITHEGILSALKSTRRQYKAKMLDSTAKTWEWVVQCFDDYTISCVLGKLTPHSCRLISRPDYAEVRNRLFERIATVPNLIFVHEDILFGEPPRKDSVGVLPAETSLDVALKSIREYGVEIVPYKLYAEVTTTAASFLEDTERNLIFRLYVPSGRLWSAEAGKFLQLFQDYLTKVGRLAVRLDHKRTDHGSIYEFHGESGTGQYNVAGEFREFSDLMDLCAADSDAAARLLATKNLQIHEITRIVEKYSKEARRLQLDIKHEAESKMISLRHRVESDLMELGPTSDEWQTIISMVAAAAPQFGSLLPSPSIALRLAPGTTREGPPKQTTYNIRQTFIQTVNGIVADEMNGTQHFEPDDKLLLEFIRTHAHENSTHLETAVYELADNSGKQVDKLKAGQKLKAFLFETMKHIGEKGTDIAFGILQKIIEKKMGL